MRKEFLMDTIGQAKDTYVMEAGMEVQEKAKRTGKRFWKVLAAAALIPVLVITAYATDFLNIKSLLSGPERFRSESYSQMDRAMDKAGFQIDAKERFENGYAFSEVRVSDTMGLDENDRTVLTYRDINIIYRNGAGNRLIFHAIRYREEVCNIPENAVQVAQVGDIPIYYHKDHYKFVPADYELTAEEELWQEQPGNFISYGSDQVEEQDVAFLSWDKDGVSYFFMDNGAHETPEALAAMASELIAG